MTPTVTEAPGVIMRVQAQRTDTDCCVAALATFLGVSYEHALVAFTRERPGTIIDGAYATTIRASAKRFGVTLRLRRDIRWDDDTGILVCYCKQQNGRHAVVLRQGLIIDPDEGRIWPEDVWRATRGASRCVLLTVAS